jgi:hypothetical protein
MPPKRFINREAVDWARDLSRKVDEAEDAGNEAEAKRLREELKAVRMKFGLCDELADGEGLDD